MRHKARTIHCWEGSLKTEDWANLIIQRRPVISGLPNYLLKAKKSVTCRNALILVWKGEHRYRIHDCLVTGMWRE